MKVEFSSRGMFLPEIDLWLDPREECGNAWLSHAHSDHAAGRHGAVIASPLTLRLYRMRWPESAEVEQRLISLNFGESLEHGGARLTCYPAGHILGAAQLLIEWRGERLVYTGDYKLQPPLCGDAAEPIPCDHLITESTFGLPIFHFLPREAARERIVAFARECLDAKVTPAFLGYPLGRGQEIVHVLGAAGIGTAVHGAIAKFIPVYEDAGYGCGDWRPYHDGDAGGRALVVVPGFSAQLEARGKRVRVAYVSGWAAMANARARARAEELIPYSDHAGFEELLATVERIGAREVDVVHGYTEAFARILHDRHTIARPHAFARRAEEENEG